MGSIIRGTNAALQNNFMRRIVQIKLCMYSAKILSSGKPTHKQKFKNMVVEYMLNLYLFEYLFSENILYNVQIPNIAISSTLSYFFFRTF